MLLLHTGRTIEGKILKAGENYVVKRQSGEMLVPKTMVRLECADLRDAYQQLRKDLPDRADAEQHLDLARWCMNAQLLHEAREETRAALAAAPGREDLREMLAKLNEVIDPKPPAPATSSSEKSQSLKLSPFTADDVESLQGLSRASAQHFVRRIQPIMMNNCMLAGCHGADTRNGLKLLRVRGGSDGNRSIAEQNLASVLRFVSLDTPKKSPLLLVPDKTHGRRGREVFTGARGAEQSREIRDWVLTLSKEINKKKRQKESSLEPETARKPEKRESPREQPASSRPSAPDAQSAGLVREILDLPPAADPFNPDAFNRQRQ